MVDERQLTRVRELRSQGCTPKQVARALGVATAEADRLVRQVAREDAGLAPEPAVVGSWVSAGWSVGLSAPADWPDTPTPGGVGNGLVSIAVARAHRHGKVSVSGYLVDVYCLGVKDVLGPKVLDDFELRGFVRTFFAAYDVPPLPAPIDMARELVWGAVAYANVLGFEPHPDFGRTAGHLGGGHPTGAITFGREGKPYFVQGVRDKPAHVLATLERSVGEGNFHFLVAV
ncbi:MAG: helix-turn-helix domain-containing protein [Acidimicrobiales bacterium]